MKVLIVHAHHEPKSFCSALYRQAVQTLSEAGHEVAVSDLYSEGFDPVSDRRNFSSVLDAGYLKQQEEERHASEVKGFAPVLEAEIRKLESCDLLIFNFPLWWFSLPAILKGWVDRAFPMGRVYGDGKIYENGLGRARKRALIIMTVGGRQESYSEYGVNPPLSSVLAPIHHGIFWFNGFLPLDPFLVLGACADFGGGA
jgi:NAD(P)H dehydrogenase (quinone)